MEIKPLTSIRGIAALWVVFFHLSIKTPVPTVDYTFAVGYTAVDMFFILSGFILSVVHNDIRSDRLFNFYIKRVFRIYPAHIFALTLLIIIWIYPHWDGIYEVSRNPELAASYLLLQAFIPMTALENPPAWSAGVEMFCYLWFPVLITIARRVPVLIAAFGLLCVAIAVEYAILASCGGVMSGIPAVARGLGGFTVGAFLWRSTSLLNLSSRTADLLASAAIGGFIVSLLARRPEILPLWFALIVLALSYNNGRIAASLGIKPLFWLGNISFSLYLLHYPVILATDKLFQVETTPIFATALRPAFILAVSLVLSDLSYRLIETPGRRIPRLLWGDRRAPSRPLAIVEEQASESAPSTA